MSTFEKKVSTLSFLSLLSASDPCLAYGTLMRLIITMGIIIFKKLAKEL